MELKDFKEELVELSRSFDEKISSTRINILKSYYPELLKNVPACSLLEFNQDNLSAIKYLSEKERLYFTDEGGMKIFFSPEIFIPIFPGEIKDVFLKNNRLYCDIFLTKNFNYDFDYMYLYFCPGGHLVNDLAQIEACLEASIDIECKKNSAEKIIKIPVRAEKVILDSSVMSINNLLGFPSKIMFLKISHINIDNFSDLSSMKIVFNFNDQYQIDFFDKNIKLNIVPLSNSIDDYAEPLRLNIEQDEYKISYPYNHTIKPYEILKLSYTDGGGREKIIHDYVSLNNNDFLYYQHISADILRFFFSDIKAMKNTVIHPYVKWTQYFTKYINDNTQFYFYSKANQGLRLKNLFFHPAVMRDYIPDDFMLDIINIKNSSNINYRYFCALLSLFKIDKNIKKILSRISDVYIRNDNKALIFHCDFCEENYLLALNFLCRYLCDFVSDLWCCSLSFEVLCEKR